MAETIVTMNAVRANAKYKPSNRNLKHEVPMDLRFKMDNV